MADATSSTITLPIGTKIPKAATEKSAAKTQYTSVLDGVLFVVNIDDTLAQKMVKGDNLVVPASKLIKAQNLVIRGGNGDFTIGKYVTIKDTPQE